MNRCPFCGGASCVTQETNELGGEEYCVQCNRCGAQGFVTSIKQEAIEAWNQRWVPPIVWEDCGLLHLAKVGGISIGAVVSCESYGTSDDIGIVEYYEPSCFVGDSDEAKAKVEEKWREAYLEMHR